MKSHLILIACVLCYQISSGRYTTKEQEDIDEKIIPMQYKTKMEFREVKCKADCNKIGQVKVN